PLGVIRGRAELISGKFERSHPHNVGLRVIIDEIDRIARTIHELLDFSRVKPASASPVDFVAVLRQTLELLHYESERRHVALLLDVPSAAPLVLANADQLQQVVVNLVMNALDASKKGGQVTVRAKGAAGSVVHIEVQDEGCGIQPENLHRVFD